MFKALLVDDEESILHMLKPMLQEAEFEVTCASSAAEAAAILAREEGFEIVVTDLKMESPLAGLDVVRAARELDPKPVIALLTAFPLPESDWRNVGADAVFIKGENTLLLPKQLKALLNEYTAGLRH